MQARRDDPLLRIEAVAERYDVPVKTVRHWRYVGSFAPAIRVGGLLRWRLSDLERWEDSRRERGDEDARESAGQRR